MIALIAKKDLLEFSREGRLYWAGGLVLVLLITALIAGFQQRQQIAAEHTAGQQASYGHWLGQGEANPHSAAHFGMFVFKPTPALSLIDPGVNPYTGTTVWLEAHQQNLLSFRPTQDATGLQRFGGFSAAWVLQTLVPLLIIVLGFAAFAGERAQGTLRQLLSIGITPRQLLWGKALSISAVLALLLLPVALVLLFVVSVDSEEEALADTLLRFVVLAFAYALYLGIFLFLALAVSAWSSSSRMALLLLLAIWIVNVMIAPRAANDLARSRHPTPSRFTFTSAMNDDLYKAWDRLLTDFHATRWADIPPSEFGNSLVAGEVYERQVADRHFDQLWGVFDRQQRVQEWGGILAPLLAIRAASAGLAGSNIAYYRDFVDATERYRRAFETRVNADAAAHGGDQGYNYRAGPELWRQIAPFSYQMPSFTWALRHTWPSFTILGLGLLMSLTLTFGALRRLRV